jgi:hypothetical protein
MPYLGEPLQIDHIGQRIGGRFEPEQACFRANSAFHLVGLGCIYIGVADAALFRHPQQRHRAAVHIANADHMLAGLE